MTSNHRIAVMNAAVTRKANPMFWRTIASVPTPGGSNPAWGVGTHSAVPSLLRLAVTQWFPLSACLVRYHRQAAALIHAPAKGPLLIQRQPKRPDLLASAAPTEPRLGVVRARQGNFGPDSAPA